MDLFFLHITTSLTTLMMSKQTNILVFHCTLGIQSFLFSLFAKSHLKILKVGRFIHWQQLTHRGHRAKTSTHREYQTLDPDGAATSLHKDQSLWYKWKPNFYRYYVIEQQTLACGHHLNISKNLSNIMLKTWQSKTLWRWKTSAWRWNIKAISTC